jgi:hypothetical protein
MTEMEKIKFKKACLYLIELLTVPYYNKFTAETIGVIKENYGG